MELFDTYFVWFGQVLAVSGMKTLVTKLWKRSHIALNSPITHTTPTGNIPEAP